jgi:autotransporter-associated beta strand protein
MYTNRLALVAVFTGFIFAGCGGGGGGAGTSAVSSSTTTYSIGGSVSGLASGTQVTLQNNGADGLTLSANGAFTFTTQVAANDTYSVTVSGQPTGQICSVSGGTGSGSGLSVNVSNVSIVCSAETLSIGGSLTGLASNEQVTLQNNGSNALTLSADGSFTFTTPVAYSGSYLVTVSSQPTGQICSVSGGTGSGAGITGNVASVGIVCSSNTHMIGGTVTGLANGAQVTLLNNGSNALTLSADGAFTFTTPVADTGSYLVSVSSQPIGQICSVADDTGYGAGVTANVANVSIFCSSDSYTVGGTVTGLASGTQVTLLNNDSNALTVSANGSFTFTTPVAYQASYAVTVSGQPTGQICSPSSLTGSGAGVSANVGNVRFVCSSDTYTISGTVTGLVSGGQVSLLNNDANALTLSANGTFTFTTPLAYSGSYAVTVSGQPTGQTCAVINATGAGVTANIGNIGISCTNGSGSGSGGSSGTNITSEITVNGGTSNIALSGANYKINLSADGPTVYSGELNGTGKLELVSGHLILTGASIFNLSTVAETVAFAYMPGNAYTYEGYAGSGFYGGTFHGGLYTIINPDPPAITIDQGATLQIGETTSSNGSGTSTTGLPGSIVPASTGTGGVIADNILDNGNLILESSQLLGIISGTGNVIAETGSFPTLEGVNTFSGVLINISQLSLGSDHNLASIPNASAIFNNGSLLVGTPVTDQLTITQNIYQNHYGNDINFDGYGMVVMSGVYSYTNSSSDNPNPLDNTDRYSLNPSLSDPSLNYSYEAGNYTGRGINVEGAVVQFGNGTTTDFFLPGNIDNTYINLHGGGILVFDYSDSGPTYDNSVIAGGGLSFTYLNAPGLGTVVFHHGDLVLTQQQYYNGTTQIDAGATVQLGDGTVGDKTTISSSSFIETSGGDGNIMQAGQSITIANDVGEPGSTSSGASTNNLVNNGALIIDNVHATELLNISGSGSMSQDGAGTTTLYANTTYTGATNIHAGVLALGSGASIASSSGVHLYNTADPAVASAMNSDSDIVAKGAATFDISQAGNQSVSLLSGTANTHVELGAHALTVGNSSSTTFSGVIADGGIGGGTGGSIDVSGTGTVTFAGVNTYSGGTVLKSGTFELTNANAAGGGTIMFASGATATLKIDGGAPVNNIDGFTSTDTILLGGFTVGTTVNVAYSSTAGTYTVADGRGHSKTLNFVTGSTVPTADSLIVASDGFITLKGSSSPVSHRRAGQSTLAGIVEILAKKINDQLKNIEIF